jgi:hypothetical protein
MDDIFLLLIARLTYCVKLFYFLCVYIFRIDEDISRFNYKYNKLLFYLHVPTTIFNKSTTQLKHVFVWRCYEKGHNITLSMDLSPVRGQYFILSVGSIFYWLRVQIFDSDSGSWLHVLGPITNCIYLVWIDLEFINTCNLNASFIHI